MSAATKKGWRRYDIEPLYGEEGLDQPDSREPHEKTAPELPAELQRIVERLTQRERERAE